jgi:hypothetical protein
VLHGTPRRYKYDV